MVLQKEPHYGIVCGIAGEYDLHKIAELFAGEVLAEDALWSREHIDLLNRTGSTDAYVFRYINLRRQSLIE